MEIKKQTYDFQLIDFVPFYGPYKHKRRVLKDVKKFGDNIPDNYANKSIINLRYLGYITGLEILALGLTTIKVLE